MKVGVLGANGRMGRRLIEAIHMHESAQLKAAFVRENSSMLGADSGELAGLSRNNITLSTLSDTAALHIDVAIDFTLPDALENHARWCIQHNVPLIIGTTGLTPDQNACIDNAAKHIPVMWAANYSLGVNVMLRLVKQASKALGKLADIEIIEAHHRNKVDAPSGTAVAIGEAIAEELGRSLDKCAVYGREGIESVRSRETIGFATVRGGDIIGEHTALFACEGERLEVTHKASTRMTFAMGAVNAATWLKSKPAGRYSMHDYVSELLVN